MKKTGEFKVDRLETKKEWVEYAGELETLLLLRPQPTDKPSKEWIEEYKEWYDKVVSFWV